MRRFLKILLLLLLIGLGIGIRYIYNRGLSKPTREWVVAEVRKHGVEVSFSRLTVRPFKGLVAKDVKVFDSPDRTRVVARVSEMIVEANYANAAQGRGFLDALTLVGASLRVPLDPKQPDGPSVTVDKLNARILFPPNQIHVSRVDAEILGIRVRASGNLAVPANSAPFGQMGNAGAALRAAVVAELKALQYEGGPPHLEVQFSGDLGDPDGILVEADLTGSGIRRGNYRLGSIAASATWQNGVLRLSRLDAADSLGRLQASGSFDPRSRTAELRVRSGMDLPALARALGLLDLGDMSFQTPPQLDLTARMDLGEIGDGQKPKYHVLGQARLGKFRFGKVPFEELSADVSWDGRRWAVREAVLRHASGGELKGDVQQDFDGAGTGDFRANLTSTLRPEFLAPFFTPEVAARMALLKFHDPPRFLVNARGSAPGPDTLSASGELRLGRTAFRGVEAKHAEARFRYNDRILSLDSMEVARPEGTGSGSVAWDFKAGTVTLKGVKQSLFPLDAAQWVDPDLIPDIRPYRFGKKPPSLLIDGVIDTRKNGPRTRLDISVSAPGGMDYTFCGKELHFGDVKGRLLFAASRLKIEDARAELFGGRVTGEADISTVKARPGHQAAIRLDAVDFTKLSKLYFNYDDAKGKLDGNFTFTGKGDDAQSMRGDGSLRISDGNVFAIPFLGPFSEITNKIIPGLGHSQARKATASFTMHDGIITTKDFIVAGKGFSMVGGGRIWFLDDKMDFDIRISAPGLPGVVVNPVGRLLEYRANSKFSKPEWRPRALPKIGG